MHKLSHKNIKYEFQEYNDLAFNLQKYLQRTLVVD